MPSDSNNFDPRMYFLNERHQLAPSEKTTGGRGSKVLNVSWSQHGEGLRSSFEKIRTTRAQSPDPTAKTRAFILASPAEQVTRSSTAKTAVDGQVEKLVHFSGNESQLLERLGFDLLAVNKSGSAIVHATDERIEQMMLSLGHLESLSQRDQNKWAYLSEFDEIPTDYKTSENWWQDGRSQLTETDSLNSIVDLQPFLTREETSSVIRAIKNRIGDRGSIKQIGTEFSGRAWLRAEIGIQTILSLAKNFQSIFSIHPPLEAITVNAPRRSRTRTEAAIAPTLPEPQTLPRVAILDTGVPEDHLILSRYLRGQLLGEGTGGNVCDSHGSQVASRVIFGDVDCDSGAPTEAPIPKCTVYDVRLGIGPGEIYPTAVESSLKILASTAPDVRVVNMSFDSSSPLDSFSDSYREAWLRRIADLDNLIFSYDILVVVAAGNTPPRVIPEKPYPNHYNDEQWKLRAWSCCFNGVTCGGSVSAPLPAGVATEPGAPSPFSRVGPGFAKSPKPDFTANAGNWDLSYDFQPGSGHGVWGCNETGSWEDICGTSFAAPLLAGEAAQLFKFLEERCEAGSKPFACLAKACLALHANLPELSAPTQKLAKVSSGYGSVEFSTIEKLIARRGVFLWQGIIGSEDDLLTVELPVPDDWITEAEQPILRMCVSADVPVNHAAESLWACRKVDITLRPSVGNKALSKKTGRGSKVYPLGMREYHLSAEDPCENSYLIELRYTHVGMAPYPGQMEFSPQQRVAFAIELFDNGESPVSPHPYIQALPVAGSLNRLSSQIPASRQAVSLVVQQSSN